MKSMKKVALACLVGIGMSFLGSGIAPSMFSYVSTVYAAEAVPMEDTWILSDGGNQYYLKGGTLQFRQPTWAVRESGAYSFQAKITCVYPDGRYETHQYRMVSKGALGVSIDGGSMMVVDSGSVYSRLYDVICSKYIR